MPGTEWVEVPRWSVVVPKLLLVITGLLVLLPWAGTMVVEIIAEAWSAQNLNSLLGIIGLIITPLAVLAVTAAIAFVRDRHRWPPHSNGRGMLVGAIVLGSIAFGHGILWILLEYTEFFDITIHF